MLIVTPLMFLIALQSNSINSEYSVALFMLPLCLAGIFALLFLLFLIDLCIQEKDGVGAFLFTLAVVFTGPFGIFLTYRNTKKNLIFKMSQRVDDASQTFTRT